MLQARSLSRLQCQVGRPHGRDHRSASGLSGPAPFSVNVAPAGRPSAMCARSMVTTMGEDAPALVVEAVCPEGMDPGCATKKNLLPAGIEPATYGS